MLKLKTPASVDRTRIDAILEEHECSGQAALVKARIQGGVYQVRIQCLRCGDHLSSALSQAAHVGWRDYPETDPAIAARFQAPSNIGPTLAVEASKILERDLICSGRLDAREAQRAIAEDWTAAYGRFFPTSNFFPPAAGALTPR